MADPLERFVDLSVVLTGFSRVELLGTGMAKPYWDELVGIVGADVTTPLLDTSARILAEHGGDPEAVDAAFADRILGDATLGPVAQNVIHLWYEAQWFQLPAAWRAAHGQSAFDVDHIVSPEAYRQGLVWQAIEAHPMGAKGQGFGAWARPPRRALPTAEGGEP